MGPAYADLVLTLPSTTDSGEATMMTTDTLAQISAIGRYFTVYSGPRPDAAEFAPLADLYGKRAALEASVTAVGRRIGTDQQRVAASTLHIGTAARLWSVALAGTVLTGEVPDLAPERLWMRVATSGPVDLWLPQATAVSRGGDLPDALYENVVVRHLLPLDEAIRRHFGLSPKVLSGNVTSALMGAVRTLNRRVPDAPHPPLPLVTALLEREPLASAGTLTVHPLAYRRHNCCLYYRVPGVGYCEECVLNG
ncbi:(2Fe-2S)-binding protein [Streptomyces sp. NPDC048611]|uniref:(2Fe-2S)-binding protein n=1 Tax=Streptomyces sp. NPDC048611 TaxID=3155635 RepID=UPI00343CBF35